MPHRRTPRPSRQASNVFKRHSSPRKSKHNGAHASRRSRSHGQRSKCSSRPRGRRSNKASPSTFRASISENSERSIGKIGFENETNILWNALLIAVHNFHDTIETRRHTPVQRQEMSGIDSGMYEIYYDSWTYKLQVLSNNVRICITVTPVTHQLSDGTFMYIHNIKFQDIQNERLYDIDIRGVSYNGNSYTLHIGATCTGYISHKTGPLRGLSY